MRANRARMQKELDAQARIGRYGETGLARVAFTEDYNRARELVRRWMEKAGLKTRVDAVGNLFGRKEGRRKDIPVVMTGSHLDSQSPGGRFDGAGGVLASLEAVRRIGETGAPHDHTIEVVAFQGEESSCGISHFGSRVVAGLLGPDEMRVAIHPPTGRSVLERLKAVGGEPVRAKNCILPKGSLKAFVELHIEQGPVLESNGVPIGIVDTVVGMRRGEVIFEGVTAHSGGQPMSYRRDAAMAAAEFMLDMEAATRNAPESQRLTLTFGETSAQPGWSSIVPGGARIVFDMRGKRASYLNRMLKRMRKTLARIEKARKVKGRVSVQRKKPPYSASPKIRRVLKIACVRAGYRSLVVTSGGRHDACEMSLLCPMGMVFVPSVKGLSHTPAEFTRTKDLAAGAEVLASALLLLAK